MSRIRVTLLRFPSKKFVYRASLLKNWRRSSYLGEFFKFTPGSRIRRRSRNIEAKTHRGTRNGRVRWSYVRTYVRTYVRKRDRRFRFCFSSNPYRILFSAAYGGRRRVHEYSEGNPVTVTTDNPKQWYITLEIARAYMRAPGIRIATSIRLNSFRARGRDGRTRKNLDKGCHDGYQRLRFEDGLSISRTFDSERNRRTPAGYVESAGTLKSTIPSYLFSTPC